MPVSYDWLSWSCHMLSALYYIVLKVHFHIISELIALATGLYAG